MNISERAVMDIYPQDLGHRNYATVLNNRRSLVGLRHKLTVKNLSFSPTPLTLMRKIWIHKLPLDEKVAEHATPAFDLCHLANIQWKPTNIRWTFLKMVVLVFFVLPFVFYASPLLIPILLLYFGVLKPRAVIKEMHQKLDRNELIVLINTSGDPLATDFFKLVGATTQTSEAVSLQDAEKMRTALYTLGNSIAFLPLLDVATENADALKIGAQTLVQQAKIETDPVVAASFQRRAEAILQRAASAEYNNTVARRSQVLRDELREQIKALRASLTTTTLNSDHHSGRLADVAASIQQIAGQANSVAAAQAEIENTYVSPAPIPVSIAKAQVLRRNL